ncbi:CRISPR-associated protein Cas4 [Parasutterella sp.]|uniref:CRISPR-associated protein Cas4 n=1 Tax=Parasutterella sp. TaxID=2049037 RepID=UPI003522736D
MLTVRTSENTVITSFRLITERQDFSSVRTAENTVRARARIHSVYPIHGIADGILIMEDGEIIPLEFKAQDNFVASRGHILQLTGYAILLEEKFQREVKQGFILYGKKGKSLRVDFTEERKKKVIEIAQKIISSFETGLLPDSPATSAQCGQCEFLNFCGDRF